MWLVNITWAWQADCLVQLHMRKDSNKENVCTVCLCLCAHAWVLLSVCGCIVLTCRRVLTFEWRQQVVQVGAAAPWVFNSEYLFLMFGEELRQYHPLVVQRWVRYHRSWRLQVCLLIWGNNNDFMKARKCTRKKLTVEAKRIVDKQMNRDDETTGIKLRKLIAESGVHVDKSTAIQWCIDLSWMSKGTSYCQMIRDVSKVKRLEWARGN